MAEILEGSLFIGFVIGFALPMTCLIASAAVAQFINYLQYERIKQKHEKEQGE